MSNDLLECLSLFQDGVYSVITLNLIINLSGKQLSYSCITEGAKFQNSR